MATKLVGRRRVAFVGLAGAVGLLAGCSSGGGSGSGGSSASTAVAPITSANQPAAAAAAPTLASGRALHTATLLKSGEVFVAGGVDASGKALDQTAILTPTSVKQGPRLLHARVGHTATILENGQVLIAGGQDSLQATAALDSTETFDPLAASVAAGPKLSAARSQAVAVSYGSVGAQKVLIAAGFDGKAPLDTADVYDVKAGTVGALKAKLAEAAAGPAAAKLDDGSIVIVGGDGLKGPAGAQVFDPAKGTFTATTITVKRSGGAFAATGREAYFGGGQSATGIEKTSEDYDLATKLFSAGPQLAAARRDATAVVVGGNELVVIGGRDAKTALRSVEVFKGTTLAQATAQTSVSLATGRYGHTSTAFSSGKILVVGGFDASGNVLASCENVDPNPAAGAMPGPTAPVVVAPPTVVTPGTGTTNPGTTNPGTTTPPSSGSGLGGLLGGLLGGGSGTSTGGSILSKVANAAITTVTTNGFSGGVGGFFKAFVGNLVNQFTGGSTSGVGGLLGSLLGGGSTSGTSTSGTSTSGTPSTSTSSGGIGGILSGLLGKVFGGGSSTGSSGTTASGVAPVVLSLSPGQGSVGDSVQITGQNLAGAQVTFTAKQGFFSKILGFFTKKAATVAAANVVVNATGDTIDFQVPTGAVTGAVTVTANGQSATAGTFTVQ